MHSMSIAANLAAIRGRIALAASRAGRAPEEIALMAVSKTHPAEAILEAIAAGQLLFGENRVQEFAAKVAGLGTHTLPDGALRAGYAPTDGAPARGAHGARFHLIGHLQSNKAARAAELFSSVDSLDSLRLAERLNEAAARLGKRLDVLIEVNIGGEEAKSGLAPGAPELLEILQAAPRLPQLNLRGLMTVPPFTDSPEGAGPAFRGLRELRDRLRQQTGLALPELSMGMSHDFEVAIEEGSTCVRVGTAIFGARPAPVLSS
jgi:hypothetical protein